MAGSRFLLSAALLAVVLVSAHAQWPPHEDGGALGAAICAKANADLWHFPHPTDCSRFIKCDVANGLSSIITCNPGLLYNAPAQVCDYPANVDCTAAPVPTTTTTTTRRPPTTTTTTRRPPITTTTTRRPPPTTTTRRPPTTTTTTRRPPTTTTTTRRPPPTTTTRRPAPTTTRRPRPPPTTTTAAPPPPPTTAAPTTASPTADWETLCSRSSPDRYHVPHPTDPTKFYKCDWTVKVAYEFDCPPGLTFNWAIQVCDW